MKKFVLALVTCVIMLTGSAYAESIGYIDLERIYVGFKDARDIQKDLMQKRDEFQKLVEEKEKSVQTAREKGKKDADITKMIEEIEAELTPKREELFKYQAQRQQEVAEKILQVTQKTAKEYGIDIVLTKQVVLFGGFDLTSFVLEKLNNAKKS